ncbi:MAG TPA: hypothetical protein VIW45_18000 [Vicinamibacterales bacterium]
MAKILNAPELEMQTIMSGRRGYISDRDLDAFDALATEVAELAHGLLRALEAKLERERRAAQGAGQITSASVLQHGVDVFAGELRAAVERDQLDQKR